MIKRLNEIDMTQLVANEFTPSPAAWEDQVLYFLMLDRFSDNNEDGFAANGTTPLFSKSDSENAVTNEQDAETWRAAGVEWAGGNLQGLANKIDYLKGLGITTIWISPIFKQVAFENAYHGYGIQNFLEVESRHFGTNDDLKALVKKAHEAGIYVILDIILNHSGNVFAYNPDRYLTTDENGNSFFDPRWDGNNYNVQGFNTREGIPSIPFSTAIEPGEDDAIWPEEFQDPDYYSQKGRIDNWDFSPEFLEGDFLSLKDVFLGTGEINIYQPSQALKNLCRIYKYWIAFADIDGYRVDTVKHMDPGAARYFASEIHEFCQKIGKENFYLIGEITGSRENAFNTLEVTGLDAALGIADIQEKLERTVKGLANPRGYFDLFRNSLLVGKESHAWFRNKVVTMFDDHDKISDGQYKTRFCADNNGEKLILNALALNVTTLGIPCIYYGSEQCFDGHGESDRYIREAMFGGKFGAFRSRGRHFFDSSQFIYTELSKILAIRKEKIVLRRGRQYLREISGDGINFGFPDFVGGSAEIRSIISWSRIFDGEEMVLGINTDFNNTLSAWVTIDNDLHFDSDRFKCIYSVDPNDIGTTTDVEERNGKAIKINVPAAGFVIYEKI